jgi:hypothetical protein
MPRKPYVFEYFLFVSRRGDPPNPWVWEIRRKGHSEGSVSVGSFRSAKAAEESGRIVLAEVRETAAKEQAHERSAMNLAKALERLQEIARRAEVAAAKAARNTPERRSENARVAAIARANALSPERRLEIARLGGAASKGKAKKNRLASFSIRPEAGDKS